MGRLCVMRVGPVVGHLSLPRIVQKTNRVLHVPVQQVVVFRHGADARVECHRDTERPQSESPVAAVFKQIQCDGR